MTIQHTSRRVVAPTVVQSSDCKWQLPPRATVSLPQAGGSEVGLVILSTTLLSPWARPNIGTNNSF